MKNDHSQFCMKIIGLMIGYSMLFNSVTASEVLTISVKNQHSEGIKNVVISAFPQDLQHSSTILPENKRVVDQVDKQFINHVTVIQKGGRVHFPNNDQIRHHVYSFSDAKTFEIPLYKGSPQNPVEFDKTGVVSLGCNIHDWMSAYIYVVDTAYFSITNKSGEATLELPTGTYQLHYWHPDMDKDNSNITKLVELSPDSSHTSSIQLHLKKAWAFRRGPLASFNRSSYR